MDPTTDKYHITGVGCASAVPLMRMAAGQSLHQHPGQGLPDRRRGEHEQHPHAGHRRRTHGPRRSARRSSVTAAPPRCSPATPTPTGRRSSPPRSTRSATRSAPSASSFSAEDSYLQLARELPDLAGAGLPGVAEKFLHSNDLEHAEIDHWIVHPGGRRIIENMQSALELSDEQTAAQLGGPRQPRQRRYPLNLLRAARHDRPPRPQPGEHGLAVTIGPGVTVGLMLLQW